MKTPVVVVGLCTLLVFGCNNKEDELQRQLSESQSEKTSLQQSIADRDNYLNEVMKTVNEVYADLEQARMKEHKLKERAGGMEGTGNLAVTDTRQKLLHDINDIGSSLKDYRKKMDGLQAISRKYQNKITGLTTLVDNLNKSLQEREQSIAQLQAQVQGLQATVEANTKAIAEKDNTIADQTKTINTGYYVVGTRDELEKKGIITKEGGFLWGLLGSTTIMSSGVDPTEFTPIDKTKDETIHVSGKIDEILPRRTPDLFATDDTQSQLTITSPSKFWQDKYLVIVVD